MITMEKLEEYEESRRQEYDEMIEHTKALLRQKNKLVESGVVNGVIVKDKQQRRVLRKKNVRDMKSKHRMEREKRLAEMKEHSLLNSE